MDILVLLKLIVFFAVWLGWTLILLYVIFWLLFVCIGSFWGAEVIYIPSHPRFIKLMLEMAKIKPNEVVYDLGSGDGRIVFAAAQQSINTFGIEVNPIFYQWSLLKKKLFRRGGNFIYGNMFKQDLSNADVIFCFLNAAVMNKLSGKFKRELKNGCRIITWYHELPGWQAEKIYNEEKSLMGKWQKLYLYSVCSN